VRQVGRADAERSGGPRGHVCCVYDRAAEYHRRLATFFSDGLRDGLRLAYSGSAGREAARAALADLGDPDRLLAEDTLHILSMEDVYGSGRPVDPDRVVASYAAATERALADGFRGLRVSADVTDLVRTPHQQDALARYEFLVGRYMAGHPLSAMCGYPTEVGTDTLTEFASLHAAAPSGEPAFQVFGCADGAIGLAGQFDPPGVAAFERVLARLKPGADTGALIVDMADVDYVDHRLLRALSDHARAKGVALSLRSAPPLVARLMALLPPSYLLQLEEGTRP
jgi:hypothetical protein